MGWLLGRHGRQRWVGCLKRELCCLAAAPAGQPPSRCTSWPHACPPAHLSLCCSKLKFRVLDECDEMLNMGFVDDVEKILNAGVDVATVQVGRLLPKPLALLMGGMCLKRA